MTKAEWRAANSKACPECGKMVAMGPLPMKQHQKAKHSSKPRGPALQRASVSAEESADPDWSGKCMNCGESPILPVTGLCGPCTFGEAETVGGNW